MITFVFSSAPSFRESTRWVTAEITTRSSPAVGCVPTRESTDSNSERRDSTVSLGDFFHFGNLGMAREEVESSARTRVWTYRCTNLVRANDAG